MREKSSEMSMPLELLQPLDIQALCERFLSKEQGSKRNSQKAKATNRCEEGLDWDTLEVGKFELKPISDGPAGFLGRHNFLNVEVIRKGKNLEDKQFLTFFTKSAPLEIASRMQYLEEFGVFKKEITVYRNVLPRIEEIFPNVAPKCYFANDNILVFENLIHQDYKIAAKRDGLLNYEHLSCALKTLAALHAGSLCLEKRKGKKIPDLYPEAVVENSYPSNVPENHLRLQNFNQATEVYKAILSTIPRYQKDLPVILSELPKKMKTIFELSKPSDKYPNVLNHGDLWSNNIMFSYSKFGEIPIQARLVDFQLARYAPPMLDLLTILTIPTSRQFRQQYLDELISDYYRFMTEFLKLENLNIEDILPEKDFFSSIEEFRIYGIIESCLFSHLTILPVEAAQDLISSTEGFSDFFNRKRIDICMKAFETDAIYRDRLTDMLEDLVDNYILKT